MELARIRTKAVTVARAERAVGAVERETSGWTRTSGESGIAAKHGNPRSVLGATERNHVLANMGCDNLLSLWITAAEDVLDEVVAKLITRNIDERHAWTIWAGFAHNVEISIQKVVAANFETLLHNLGCKLIHAVLRCKANHVVDGASAIGDGAMLANVLDAPVSELTVGYDVNARQDLADAWAFVFLETVLEDVLDD